jgi:hypothetical protein
MQSEAFEAFAQDFAHMKSKILQMQQNMNTRDDKVAHLED